MSDLSSAAKANLEAARQSDGKFGTQPHSNPGQLDSLTGDAGQMQLAAVKDRCDADGKPVMKSFYQLAADRDVDLSGADPVGDYKVVEECIIDLANAMPKRRADDNDLTREQVEDIVRPACEEVGFPSMTSIYGEVAVRTGVHRDSFEQLTPEQVDEHYSTMVGPMVGELEDCLDDKTEYWRNDPVFSDHVKRSDGSLKSSLVWQAVDDEGEPVEADIDVDEDGFEELNEQWRDFAFSNHDLLVRAQAADNSYGLDQAAHDFVLTRNGHGTGFWDRGLGEVGEDLTAQSKPYGEVNTYVGDDGVLYLGV